MKKNSKRLLSLLLTFLLLFSAFPLSASAAVKFSDVPSGAWYYKDVNSLVSKGIMTGTGNNMFSPNSHLTRGQVTAILARVALSETDLNQYSGYTNFSDVGKSVWFTKYINWAYSTGVVSGYSGGVFKPFKAVTREELASMINNLCNSLWYKLSTKNSAVTFKDSSSISSWAKTAVTACQRAGVITGSNGKFSPKSSAKRSEVAAMINRLVSGGYSKDSSYTVTRKKVWGYSSDYVEVNSSALTGNIVLGKDKLNGAESASSIVSRTGAKVAVNAAFFNMSSYTPYSTIVINDKVIKTDDGYAPHRPAFSIDSVGRASIENFTVVRKPVLVKANGKEVELTNTATNVYPSNSKDASRIIYTNTWGSKVGIYVRDAIAVNSSGKITAVVSNVDDISIPSGGYVIYQRSRREYEGEFFDSCAVGDTIRLDTTYQGASRSSIKSSIGVGPRIVKDGSAYGSTSTFIKEGFSASDITSGSARRVGIGVKSNGNVVILTAYCTVAQLGKIMASTGCKNAINLDGGGSTAIYIDGKWLRSPDRLLSNMIYFK